MEMAGVLLLMLCSWCWLCLWGRSSRRVKARRACRVQSQEIENTGEVHERGRGRSTLCFKRAQVRTLCLFGLIEFVCSDYEEYVSPGEEEAQAALGSKEAVPRRAELRQTSRGRLNACGDSHSEERLRMRSPRSHQPQDPRSPGFPEPPIPSCNASER